MVVRLARILGDGPLIVVMRLVSVRHAPLLNWNTGVRGWFTVVFIRARVWLLAMLGFGVLYVPCNMMVLVLAGHVIRTAPVWLLA